MHINELKIKKIAKGYTIYCLKESVEIQYNLIFEKDNIYWIISEIATLKAFVTDMSYLCYCFSFMIIWRKAIQHCHIKSCN